MTQDELADDAKGCEADYEESGASCSNCGSFCTSTRTEQMYMGRWSAGVPLMETVEIQTCSVCGNVEEV